MTPAELDALETRLDGPLPTELQEIDICNRRMILDEQAVKADYRDALAAIRELREAINQLHGDVCAFATPWACFYARSHHLPPRHLHWVHYDVLAKCGARMDEFIRFVELASNGRGGDKK